MLITMLVVLLDDVSHDFDAAILYAILALSLRLKLLLLEDHHSGK